MLLLQINVRNGKNSSEKFTLISNGDAEIHSADPVPEITISEATQRYDKYTEQLVTECKDNRNNVWWEVEERISGVIDTLLQEPDTTENVEKVITFVPGEGNKPLGIFMEKDFDSYHFQLFTVVKLELIIKAEQHLSITVQGMSEN